MELRKLYSPGMELEWNGPNGGTHTATLLHKHFEFRETTNLLRSNQYVKP